MAEQPGAPEAGLFTTLKALSSNLLAIVQTRLELLSTDVAEERERLLKLLVMVLIALFCLGVGVLLLALLIVVMLWESNRLYALAGMIVFFLGAGLGVGWTAVQWSRRQPRLFDASITELSKDRQDLTSGS
jgi:uncharacterized membrane protein YqjE